MCEKAEWDRIGQRLYCKVLAALNARKYAGLGDRCIARLVGIGHSRQATVQRYRRLAASLGRLSPNALPPTTGMLRIGSGRVVKRCGCSKPSLEKKP